MKKLIILILTATLILSGCHSNTDVNKAEQTEVQSDTAPDSIQTSDNQPDADTVIPDVTETSPATDTTTSADITPSTDTSAQTDAATDNISGTDTHDQTDVPMTDEPPIPEPDVTDEPPIPEPDVTDEPPIPEPDITDEPPIPEPDVTEVPVTDPPITQAPEPEKLSIPSEPKLTSNNAVYYSVNGTNPYGGCYDYYDGSGPDMAKQSLGGSANGTGALGVLINSGGGYLVIPGKAWVGTDQFDFPYANGAVVITGKDPKTNKSYIGTVEDASGSNGSQTGMFMIKNNGTVSFSGEYIFDNTVILHRSQSSSMQFNILSGGKLVINSSVRFERMTISPSAPFDLTRVNVADGAYLYLHAVGFSSYTGNGTIVIDRALINSGKASIATFKNFGGTVTDEHGSVIYKGNGATLKSRCPMNSELGENHECVLDTTTDGIWNLTSFKSKQHPNITMRYKVYIPKNFDPDKQYPFFMYLHGNGGSTMNISTQFSIHSALRNFISETGGDAVVIFPQCINGDNWPFCIEAREVLMELIEHLSDHVNIDQKRIYISGHSYGAFGTLTLLSEHPGYFAAAFITSFGTTFSDSEYKNIVKTPIRMYCGANDEYGFAEPMEKLAHILKNEYHGDVEFTLYGDLGHGQVYTRAGNDMNFIRWILAQRAK